MGIIKLINVILNSYLSLELALLHQVEPGSVKCLLGHLDPLGVCGPIGVVIAIGLLELFHFDCFNAILQVVTFFDANHGR